MKKFYFILIETHNNQKRNPNSIALIESEIIPIFLFPQHMFPTIRSVYKSELISFEVAKKTLDLLEVTFIEKVDYFYS